MTRPTMEDSRRAPLMMETYYGAVRSPADAIKLFEACRLGLLPRVQRRLSEKERQAIRSGSVFVWDEREAGMRRWTDGKSWSASRVSGSFLTYREMEGKRGNAFGGGRRGAGKTPDSGRGSDEDHDDGEPDGYRYKPDGLTKQSFSITNSAGQHLHLIAYYARGPLDLMQPTNDPALRHIIPAKGMYPESSLAETNSSRAPASQPHYYHNRVPPPHPFPSPYPHPSYGWPPSPVGTPPYAPGHPYPPYNQGPPPPHSYHHYPPHPSQHYSQPPQYERPALPPPPPPAHPQLPAPVPPKALPQPYSQNQRSPPPLPPPRLAVQDSPRSQPQQAQSREAVHMEPRLAPIDAGAQQQQQQQQYHNGHRSPRSSPRELPSPYHQLPPPTLPPPTSSAYGPGPVSPTASPPRSATEVPGSRPESQTSSASTRPSLSALLLHPPTSTTATATASEPSSANPASAGTVGSSGGNSPGPGPSSILGAVAAAAVARVGGEDARAIGALNKNFF